MDKEREDEVEAHAFDATREATRAAARSQEPRDEAEVEAHSVDATREATRQATREAT
jgi:hypothetical protein